MRAELGDEVARLVGPPRERECGDGEEQQGHEREQREVGDHRGEVGAPVGEELPQRSGHGREYGLC
jgi:hypothetical protein